MKKPKQTRKIIRGKPRKVRANAKLKTLGKPLQEEIILFAENHTLAETAEWLLKTKEIAVSCSAVSTFLNQHRMQWKFERSAAVVEALLVCVKELDPTITPEKVREAG